jgi:hypothetical protein
VLVITLVALAVSMIRRWKTPNSIAEPIIHIWMTKDAPPGVSYELSEPFCVKCKDASIPVESKRYLEGSDANIESGQSD